MTLSMRADNRYRFECPLTEKVEIYLACIFKRYKHWRGEKTGNPICATCMNANKCPAVHMIKREDAERRAIYFDTTDRIHKLDAFARERTERVMVSPIQAYGTGIDMADLSRLCGHTVTGIPTSIPVPPRPNAAKAPIKPTRVKFRSSADSAEVLDHVAGDMTEQLNAALENSHG